MKDKRTVLAGLVAAFFGICAFAAYIRDLLINPAAEKSLAAWIIWTIVGLLIFKSYVLVGKKFTSKAQGSNAPNVEGLPPDSVAQREGETEDSKLLPLIYALGPPIICVFLYFTCHITTVRFTSLDWALLTISVLSGIYLWFTRDGLLTLHINMAIDIIGAVLVAKNALEHSGAESIASWVFFTLAGSANLFAVKKWRYRYYVYPVMTTSVSAILLACSIFG